MIKSVTEIYSRKYDYAKDFRLPISANAPCRRSPASVDDRIPRGLFREIGMAAVAYNPGLYEYFLLCAVAKCLLLD